MSRESREPATDEETTRLLEALERALPYSLYQCAREEIIWRDEQIRVLKRVIYKLVTLPEENP